MTDGAVDMTGITHVCKGRSVHYRSEKEVRQQFKASGLSHAS